MKNLIFISLLIFGVCQLVSTQLLTKEECKCQIPRDSEFKSKVVNGHELQARYCIPWHATLSIWDDKGYWHVICGGVIINHQMIATSASCLSGFKDGKTLDDMQISTGLCFLRDIVYNRTTNFKVEKVYIDKRYDEKNESRQQVGDIAFIKINGTIKFSSSLLQPVGPACLGGLDYQDYDGELSLTAVGFGSERKLTRSEVKTRDFRPPSQIKASHYDYIHPVEGEDHLIKGYNLYQSICEGDIGGALMYDQRQIYRNGEDRKIKVVGLNQFYSSIYNEYIWTSQYCTGGQSGFTRLSFYKNVIESVPEIGKNYCS